MSPIGRERSSEANRLSAAPARRPDRATHGGL